MPLGEPDYQIRILDWQGDAESYISIPVDAEDPRFNDPLVLLKDFRIAGESFYFRSDGNNFPYLNRIKGSLSEVWCRRLIAEKLFRINERLQEYGAELYVWDIYRPIECQRGLWNFYCAEATRDMPGATEQQKRKYVLKYVSDPTRFVSSNPTTWPAHSTGAAVDLTLRDRKTLQLLDMGARFDEMSAVIHSDYFEREPKSERSERTDIIRRNRRLLHWALTQEGFVNYPLEYWHFDWGNQMYVHNLCLLAGFGPEAAWYGYVEVPTAPSEQPIR
jgi:zinc D-Ala-D-Ala dipeptidase